MPASPANNSDSVPGSGTQLSEECTAGSPPVDLRRDASRNLYDAAVMDEKAIRGAALITLRRSTLKRFPPEPERRAWLRWAAGFAKS